MIPCTSTHSTEEEEFRVLTTLCQWIDLLSGLALGKVIVWLSGIGNSPIKNRFISSV